MPLIPAPARLRQEDCYEFEASLSTEPHFVTNKQKKIFPWELGDGTVVRNTGCFYRGFGFSSQHPHGD